MCILLEKRFTNLTSVKYLNRISMEALWKELTTEFGEKFSITISRIPNSIDIIPQLSCDIFTFCEIEEIIDYCKEHHLLCYFDCLKGRIVLWKPSTIS